MRKNVHVSSLEKVRKYFLSCEFPVTVGRIRSDTNIDYQSIQLILDMLISEGYVVKEGNKFRRNSNG